MCCLMRPHPTWGKWPDCTCTTIAMLTRSFGTRTQSPRQCLYLCKSCGVCPVGGGKKTTDAVRPATYVAGFHVLFLYDPFYGRPPNFSSTKSPASKPAPSRISWNTVSLDTPRSSIVRRLHTRKNTDTYFSIVSFLVSSSHETIAYENRRCWGGAIVESVISGVRLDVDRAPERAVDSTYGLNTTLGSVCDAVFVSLKLTRYFSSFHITCDYGHIVLEGPLLFCFGSRMERTTFFFVFSGSMSFCEVSPQHINKQ